MGRHYGGRGHYLDVGITRHGSYAINTQTESPYTPSQFNVGDNYLPDPHPRPSPPIKTHTLLIIGGIAVLAAVLVYNS